MQRLLRPSAGALHFLRKAEKVMVSCPRGEGMRRSPPLPQSVRSNVFVPVCLARAVVCPKR
jgi:hypothetical protein